MERSRAFRHAKRQAKGWRRIKEDRNQHHDTHCDCFAKEGTREFGRVFARFADYPKACRGACCANPRRSGRLTMSERRAAAAEQDQLAI